MGKSLLIARTPLNVMPSRNALVIVFATVISNGTVKGRAVTIWMGRWLHRWR